MTIIKKKLWPEYFDLVNSGKKKFELRVADFDIKEGDTLVLEEWDPKTKEYTGRKIERKIGYFLKFNLDAFGQKEEILKNGLLAIGLEKIDNKINFEEFKKIDLRTAKILEAEKLESSDKLVKLQIDLGQEKRQILAGIQQYYPVEELIGRTIIVVANLEPKKMAGSESQGMLLAADIDGTPILLMPDKETPPGTQIH
jgi:methionine--tRNA ligase beta chain